MHAPVMQTERAPVPPRAVVLSVLALAVPVIGAFLPGGLDAYAPLLWLLALVPAFLLAYYKGWRGITASLALGMAALSVTQGVRAAQGRVAEDWTLFLLVVFFYITISLGIGYLSDALKRERALAELRALTDDLTGLPNRRSARQFMDRAFQAAQFGGPISVIVFDLDGFKAYNDRFGHSAGDAAIVAFGRILYEQTPLSDLASRYGGEEFVAVVAMDAEDAVELAERVRRSLARARGLAGPITVSAGVAEFSTRMRSADELIDAADRALYRAKTAGRDRVHAAPREAVAAS